MKNLKLIVLMLLTANVMFAQQDPSEYSAPDPRIPPTDNSNHSKNTLVGYGTGINANIEKQNTFVGYKAGMSCISGNNAYVGVRAGEKGTTGAGNMAFGNLALYQNRTGSNNVAIGNHASRDVRGSFNISIGGGAGKSNIGGDGTIAIGYAAGFWNNGSRNVFIGNNAGNNQNLLTNVSDKLFIQNSGDVTTPLIYGDFATKQVGIGTSNVLVNPVDNIPYTLSVNGHVLATEVTVKEYNNWPDYVFAEDYDLMPLNELEKEIEKLGHLPEVPSAEEVLENGHQVGEMNVILLKKVEEMTLHLIEMNKAIKTLQESEKELREENEALKLELHKK